MGFKGLFFFNNNNPRKSKTDSSIKLQSGYIVYDKRWFNANPELAPTFVYIKKENKEVTDLSELFINANSLYGKQVLVDGSDFFLQSISSRERKISWGICYDEEKKILMLARDPFGNFPLYYIHQPNEFVAFATDIPSLLGLAEISNKFYELNPLRVANYLSGVLKTKSSPYDSHTIYDTIQSVLPGYVTKFKSSKSSSTLYNIYNPDKWSGLNNVHEYGKLVRDFLSKSIYRQSHSKNIVGAHLSGGLDSSSVCALTRQCFPEKVLHTYYNNTNTTHTNETHYASEVALSIKSFHHLVKPSFKELDAVILNTSIYGQPDQMMASPAMQWDVFRKVQNNNCEQLLTGLDGDGIIGYGQKYIFELYQKQDWNSLRLLLDKSSSYNYTLGKEVNSKLRSKKAVYFNYLFKYFVQSIRRNSFKDSLNIIQIAYTKFDISPLTFIKRGGKAMIRKLEKNELGNIHSRHLLDLIKDRESNNIITSLPKNFAREQRNSYGEILFDSTIRVTEELFEVGKHLNILISHPFYDVDLYELCLAVPQSIKYSEGLFRGHLREAMRGILPENIRLRTDKAAFDLYYKISSQQLYKQSRDYLLPHSPIWEYVNRIQFESAIRILHSNQTFNIFPVSITVNQTIFFAIFLDMHSNNLLRKYDY